MIEPDALQKTLTEWLPEIAGRLGLELGPCACGQFLEYARLLREWNEKVNLTAVVDDEGIALRHFLDSLTLLPFLAQQPAADPRTGLRLADIGTGAGFPGLPLKIARPDLQVLLLDALAKRVKFLDTVIASLNLTGISALHARAEDAAHQGSLREKFDIATARAVAPLPVLCEYCLPFVRIGGAFLAMKGQAAETWNQSRRAIRALGGELSDVKEFLLPGTDMQRTILVISKITATPPAFPRKAGKPEQRPLV